MHEVHCQRSPEFLGRRVDYGTRPRSSIPIYEYTRAPLSPTIPLKLSRRAGEYASKSQPQDVDLSHDSGDLYLAIEWPAELKSTSDATEKPQPMQCMKSTARVRDLHNSWVGELIIEQGPPTDILHDTSKVLDRLDWLPRHY